MDAGTGDCGGEAGVAGVGILVGVEGGEAD